MPRPLFPASPRMLLPVALLAALPAVLPPLALAADDQERGNFFGDPFLQVTQGLTPCPTPEGPAITRAQARAEAHGRIERGTSCYQAGRCRLPNAYQYDKEIIPRVKKAVEADGRFAATSVWAEGQRRWVWLKGCVRSEQEARELERLVRGIDDVENVIVELKIVPAPSAQAAPASRP